MTKIRLKINLCLIFVASLLLLASCATHKAKKVAPLPRFTPTATVHEVFNVKASGGTDHLLLNLVPATVDKAIIIADYKGDISAVNRFNGNHLWSIKTKKHLTSGPYVYRGKIFVTALPNKVIALSRQTGRVLWQQHVSSKILALPNAANNILLIKSIDGNLTALNSKNGQIKWQLQETLPDLKLYGDSRPEIVKNTVVVGFASGKLVALSLQNGSIKWQHIVAMPKGTFAPERLVDINADPVIENGVIYAATYQGYITAIALADGRTIWHKAFSCRTGLTIQGGVLFATDSDDNIVAFNKQNGSVLWRQTALAGRELTGPLAMKNNIVVGDKAGYLHWLRQKDGRFVVHTRLTSASITATPVASGGILYALANNGRLAAYMLRK